MSERSEIDTTSSGGDGGSRPAISLWWVVPVIMAGCAGLGLLGGVLQWALDLPRDSNPSLAAIMILAITAGSRRPETFRQLGLIAAVGVVVGACSMGGYLAFALFAQGLEDATRSHLARVLGMMLSTGLGAFGALLTYHRLGLPSWSETCAKDQT